MDRLVRLKKVVLHLNELPTLAFFYNGGWWDERASEAIKISTRHFFKNSPTHYAQSEIFTHTLKMKIFVYGHTFAIF